MILSDTVEFLLFGLHSFNTMACRCMGTVQSYKYVSFSEKKWRIGPPAGVAGSGLIIAPESGSSLTQIAPISNLYKMFQSVNMLIF